MPTTRDQVFSRVVVDHLDPDATRVNWTLSPNFTVTGTRSFQLQTSQTGEFPDATWVDVGLPTTSYWAADDTRRRQGKALDTVYRVVLTIGSETWYSPAATSYGLLTKREWLLARAIIRRRRLAYAKRDALPGWLFKRRDVGDPVTVNTVSLSQIAVNPLTDEVVNARQPLTVGTEYTAGYYPPVPVYMVMTPDETGTVRDPDRGMIADSVHQAECLAYPVISARDVWIAAHNDQRFYVTPKKVVSALRQVPLVVVCELREAPTGDAIYQLEVES